MENVEVKVTSNELFARTVAGIIVEKAMQAISTTGVFRLALSGGNTPIAIFKQLVEMQESVEWSKVQIYWVDERCVAHDSTESNFGNAKRNLLDLLNEQPAFYPMHKGGVIDSAFQYEEQMLEGFGESKDVPAFDLILLGVGEDGHVASLFPGDNALAESTKWVSEVSIKDLKNDRLTMTLPVLNNAKFCLFIAKSLAKASVVGAFLTNDVRSDYPCCLVKPKNGRVMWVVDSEIGEALNIV